MKLKERISTKNFACNTIVDVLLGQGVKNAVVSPGSRNAPMIVALSRCEGIRKYVIVDERSAAFVALGLSQQQKEPVALVCTSGSAVLNYAPAIAEAYYQRLPLIVVSADRPKELIDQNDSQTIRQEGVLSSIVKKSYNINYNIKESLEKWSVNRVVNEAVIVAREKPAGPVHINIGIGEPLCETEEYSPHSRIIENVEIDMRLSEAGIERLSTKINGYDKVMVLATMTNDSNQELTKSLSRFAERDNVVVMTETVSNLKDERFITTIDRLLSVIEENEREELAPQLLISFGGSPITRMLKTYLRTSRNIEQWSVDEGEGVIDTMQNLIKKIRVSPECFFREINAAGEASAGKKAGTSYKETWQKIRQRARETHEKFIDQSPWSDLKAFSIVLPSVPSDCNLQLSNGTAIRYAQLFETPNIRKTNCNRGVAGIDGCTSTALGASLAYDKSTLLITGDMSLSYDLNGLATQYKNSKLKIIVMCNGGGGIFRFIKGPDTLEELEDYFEVHQDIPVEGYAKTFGFAYYKADTEAELKEILPRFYSNDKQSILAINTPRKENAAILREYFNRTK